MRSISRTSTRLVATEVNATTTAAAPKISGTSQRRTNTPCDTPTTAQAMFIPVSRAAELLRSLEAEDIGADCVRRSSAALARRLHWLAARARRDGVPMEDPWPLSGAG